MVEPKTTPHYIPDRGDIVWLQYNPQAGSEQAGHRPALVISPRSYNKKVGLALFCPLSTKVKGYPFEVLLPAAGKATGAVLADQVKSLDWRSRQASRFDKASPQVMSEVIAKLLVLVGLGSPHQPA